MTDKKYYTAHELAERYRVKFRTIFTWASVGKFPKPVMLNGSARWDHDDVEKWEKEQKK